jgi:CheY-like chemotaxis protein/HPt (histidine-containing phosphotransfer) domain-containing protein
MGGRISLASTLGQGATFGFDLHLPVLPYVDERTVLPSAVTGARVLVVDDSAAARMVLAVALAGFPLRVDVVDSAKAALAAIEAQDRTDPYRLVFTDWRMPGMDGTRLIDAVRSARNLAQPPKMVLVTAYGNDAPRSFGDISGVDGVLFKPVGPSALTDLLQDIFAAELRPAPVPNVQFTRTAPRFAGVRILLAEDNAINQQIAVELLASTGIVVDVAESGQQVVDMALGAPTDRYALIFMDLQMPHMDGHEATIAIRQDERLAALPIVALTAHATGDIRERCTQEGMQDYLTKPIQPEALLKLLERWLPASGAATPQAEIAAEPRDDTPAFEGLTQFDPAVGLRHMAGNERLYRKLLHRFLDAHRGTVAQLTSLLAEGDCDTATRHVHTLSGLAGTMGAARVQAAAAVLESALAGPARLPEEDLQAMITELGRVLSPLLAELASLDDSAASDAAVEAPVDATQIDLALTELASLLDACSGKAIHCFERYERQLRAYYSSREVDRLGGHVRACEFDVARELLDGLAAS